MWEVTYFLYKDSVNYAKIKKRTAGQGSAPVMIDTYINTHTNTTLKLEF